MKQHHPDAAAVAPQGTGSLAALLNRSYAILRNADSRARYDAHLVRQSAGRAVRPGSGPVTALLAYKASNRNRSRLASALVALLAATLVFQLWTIWVNRFPPDKSYRTETRVARPAPDLGRTMTMARKASASTAAEAELYSRRCFEDANQHASPDDTDLCILFDEAYIYWNGNPVAGPQLPSYFHDAATEARHLRAIAGEDSDPLMRMEELRKLAYQALLAQVAAEAAMLDGEVQSDATPLSALERPSQKETKDGKFRLHN